MDESTILVKIQTLKISHADRKTLSTIIEIGKFVQENPFPVLTNTVLLKLSLEFRNTESNFIRFWLAKHFFEGLSEENYLAIMSKHVIIKRLATVLDSNDPIARALTLRVFGYMGMILKNRTDIHVLIEKRLGEATGCEFDAALFASRHLCNQSVSFCERIFPLFVSLLKSLECELEKKLKVLKNVRYIRGSKMEDQVIELCHYFLEHFPSEDFTIQVIKVFSRLSRHASVENTVKILEFLFKILEDDQRLPIKMCVLQQLAFLSGKISFFHQLNFSRDILFQMMNIPIRTILIETSKIFYQLSRSSLVCQDWFTDSAKSHLYTLAHHANTEISLNILSCLYNLSFHNQSDFLRLAECIVHHLHHVKDPEWLTKVSKLAYSFVKNCPEIHVKYLITTSVIDAALMQSDCNQEIFSKFLLRLSQIEKAVPFSEYERLISPFFDQVKNSEIIPNLSGIVFFKSSGEEWKRKLFDKLVEKKDFFSLYKTNEYALRSGDFEAGERISSILLNEVRSERSYFWIKSLLYLCIAERKVSGYFKEKSKLIPFSEFSTAIASLEASESPFQLGYVRLRLKFYQLLFSLSQKLHLHDTKPLFSRSGGDFDYFFQTLTRDSHQFNQLSLELSEFIRQNIQIDNESYNDLILWEQNINHLKDILAGVNSVVEKGVFSGLKQLNLSVFQQAQHIQQYLRKAVTDKIILPRYFFIHPSKGELQLEIYANKKLYNPDSIIRVQLDRSNIFNFAGIINESLVKRKIHSVKLEIQVIEKNMQIPIHTYHTKAECQGNVFQVESLINLFYSPGFYELLIIPRLVEESGQEWISSQERIKCECVPTY